jgi:hypothetical protein
MPRRQPETGALTRIVCAIALLALATGAARSQDRACKWFQWGFGFFKVEQGDGVWRYSLTASGPRWRHTDYGYHAPGYLFSEEAGGLYYFRDSEHADLWPGTATERIERRKEWFATEPIIPIGPEHLEPIGSREAISLGRSPDTQ